MQLAGEVSDVGQEGRGVGCGVVAEDPGAAAVGPVEAEQAADGGGLAGPVRAEEAEDLPLVKGQAHVGDPPAPTEGLGEVFGDDRSLAHAALCSFATSTSPARNWR